jgi:hypothetical protein
MANYCPNCGQSVSASDRFCSSCGAALDGSTANTTYATNTANVSAGTTSSGVNTVAGILGTLVTVSLIGGLTRQLYYYGGRYFLDPYCRRPYGSPHLICGRFMGGHPMMGGPHGGFGGPGGGPHGGGFGGPGGGPRGGGPGGGHR